MAEILCSFDVYLCVCAQRTSQSDQFKIVKATDFQICDAFFQGHSGHDPLKIFRKGGMAGVT